MMIDEPQADRVDAALIPLGDEAQNIAIGLLASLRRAGLAAYMGLRGNMKKRLQRADAAGARYAIILGEDEVASSHAQLKDLQSGEQRAVPFESLVEVLSK